MLRGEAYKRVQNGKEPNNLSGNPFVAFLDDILIYAIQGVIVAGNNIKLAFIFPLIFCSRGGQLKHMTNENYAGNKPVLIVEDIVANRELFALQLRQFGLATAKLDSLLAKWLKDS